MKRLAALLACLLPPLSAQEIATIGTFATPDGTPIANATVTFATSPPDVFDLFAPPHLVEATTDDAGRFKVKLRQGAAHSAWAIGPADSAGRWRSVVSEGVVAGSVLALRAEQERTASKPIRFVPNPELGSGPFTLEVRGAALHGPAIRLPLPAEGVLELPELPEGRSMLRLLRADGRVAVGWFWPLGERTQTGPLRRCAVRVVDEAGQPVEGARVAALASGIVGGGGFYQRCRSIDSMVEGARTDAEGRTVVVAAEHYLHGFVAWTADRHARLARRYPQVIVDGALTQEMKEFPGDDVPIELVLRAGPVLSGRVRRGTQPLAGRGVGADVEVICRWSDGNGSSASSGAHTTHTTVTDAEGRFSLPDVVRPVGALRLAFETGDAVPTIALPRPDVPSAPLDVDLSAWPTMTLGLQSDGPVPPTTRFLLWPADPEHDGSPVVLVGERSGRAQVRLEPGAWFLFATDGERYAAQCLEVRGGINPELTLPSTPLAVMSGRLMDAEGKPMVGSGFSCNGCRGSGSGKSPVQRLLAAHLTAINGGLVGLTKSDASGAYQVRFLALPGLVSYGFVGGLFGIGQIEFLAGADHEFLAPK